MITEEWGHEMNTRDLINEAYSLPVEERVRVVNSLLQSLNKPETKLDKKWTAVAHRRLKELQNGSVETIPGKEVFEKVWKRFHE
jgi:putative addiction module component (TIGR02574 family)